MTELIWAETTRIQVEDYLRRPGHAVLISGPAGIGKDSVADYVASRLVNCEIAALASYPYCHRVTTEKTSIPVEAIRGVSQFLQRKVPRQLPRLILIPAAETLTAEAQNALLKTLEEPPSETYIILIAQRSSALLPTVRSRLTELVVGRPAVEAVDAHFAAADFSAAAIRQARLMSGGLPGLMHAILYSETEHPLLQAASTARQILGASSFERLCLVDGLAKDRALSQRVLTMLQEMAHLALAQSPNPKQWQSVLKASFQAQTELAASAQPKLVLTNLMMAL